jgi:hypothetical protein
MSEHMRNVKMVVGTVVLQYVVQGIVRRGDEYDTVDITGRPTCTQGVRRNMGRLIRLNPLGSTKLSRESVAYLTDTAQIVMSSFQVLSFRR